MSKARLLARLSALAPVALGLLLVLPLLSCGEEPKKPPRLTNFKPAIPSVTVGESLTITVAYDPGDYEIDHFEWTAAAGEIDGNGQAEITYVAPAEKGNYKLTVAVAYAEETVALDTMVKVLAAPSAPTPPAAETVESPAAPAADSATTAASIATEAPPAETGEAAPEAKPATAAPAAASAAAPATETAAKTAGETAATAPATEAAAATGTPTAEATAAPAATEPAVATSAATAEPSETPAEVAAPATKAATAESPPPATVETATTTAAAGTDEPPTTTEAPATEVAALTEKAAETPSAPAPAPTPAAATAPEPSRIDEVLARGTLRAIVQIGFEPFSFLGADGRRVGFEVDLVRELARRWLGDAQAVELLAVPTDARIPTLVDGRGDLIAAALTDTPARREQVDFSITYFKDGQRLLVPAGASVADPCALRGRKIAVVGGSTSRDNIEAAAKDCGFAPDLVEFRRHADAVEALLAGDVQAFTSDGIALENFAEGEPLQVVGNHFSDEPYGVAVPKGDRRFRQLVDSTLVEMQADGTLAAIYQKWFDDTIAPYPLDMPAPSAVPIEVAAAITSDAPPVVEPITGTGPPVTAYVVAPGDTLSKIAGKVWGDVGPHSWRRLYEANRAIIGDDPAKIEVGMKLQVPPA